MSSIFPFRPVFIYLFLIYFTRKALRRIFPTCELWIRFKRN